MERFDAAYLEQRVEHNLAAAAAFKEGGGKVGAVYCAFMPKELIAAAGALPVSLCAGSERPIAAAEQSLPRNLCPLIKSSFGFAITDQCPYFHDTDFILADATCDGKKKMFELLAEIKPLQVMLLPQSASNPEALDQWHAELRKAKASLELLTGNTVTDEALREQIRRYNALRRTTRELYALNEGEVPLAFGRELAVITDSAGFDIDLPGRLAEMARAVAVLRARAQDKAFMHDMRSRPRILLTGCPNTNKKVLHLLEDAGGVVVAMENCGGLKTAGLQVDEWDDPLRALARSSLAVACPCMTPNAARLDLLGQLIDAFAIDGVVELIWQACHTYNIEAFSVRRHVMQMKGVSYLQIETDYSESDVEQLRVRIEAFLEMLC